MKPSYTIRPMRAHELTLAIEWAAGEGWNPGLHDAACFYAADPTGFFVGELNGEAISGISAVKYGTHFGFVGLYIVKPGFRGQGYGLQLWDYALATLAGRNIALDGEVAFAELLAYDANLFPASRDTFLKAWIDPLIHTGFGVKVADKLVGFAVLRECLQGYKIGPMYADIPEANPLALALVQNYNMQPIFETARMYTGPFPAVDIDKLFGVTSLELG
ncbi:GNAT family N-acetyltransferase [Aliidiomarina celeris]|uniref:GNAT family N-acetyltransferase n=1 Tax=Aliidiomarina celeris TaxID=2249428 RepID=UPI001E317EFB|nr:GNAT family N-acetyltransferase [Aliidiomarina celeris]